MDEGSLTIPPNPPLLPTALRASADWQIVGQIWTPDPKFHFIHYVIEPLAPTLVDHGCTDHADHAADYRWRAIEIHECRQNRARETAQPQGADHADNGFSLVYFYRSLIAFPASRAGRHC
jgi:hypothetical protein